MFIRITNGQPEKYSIGQLRRDNPQTSFPKSIPNSLLARYGMYPVKQTDAPSIDSKTHSYEQRVELVDNEWTQIWQVVELPFEQAAANIRAYRNKLLATTDWMALSDNTLTPEWSDYRQALRNITEQEGFPYSVEWPEEPAGE